MENLTTMERLFLEIFDRKSRIERQLYQQLESYVYSLACNVIAGGGLPPPWIWEMDPSAAGFPKNAALNKEQHISGMSFPFPMASKTLADRNTYFNVVDVRCVSECHPNSIVCKGPAIDNSRDVKSLNNLDINTSKLNHDKKSEAKVIENYSDIDEMDCVPNIKHGHISSESKDKITKVLQKGRIAKSWMVSEDVGFVENSSACNRSSNLKKGLLGMATRSRSRLLAQEYNFEKLCGTNSLNVGKDGANLHTDCQSNLHPLKLADPNSHTFNVDDVDIAHMHAIDASVAAKIFRPPNNLFLFEQVMENLNGIEICQVNENSFSTVDVDYQICSNENALNRPVPLPNAEEGSALRQHIGIHASQHKSVQQCDTLLEAEHINASVDADGISNEAIEEGKIELLVVKDSEGVPHLDSGCMLPKILATSSALFPTEGVVVNSCKDLLRNQVFNPSITRGSLSPIFVKRSGVNEAHLQSDISKGNNCRKNSVVGLDIRRNSTCDTVSSKLVDCQSCKKGSFCGAHASLVEMLCVEVDTSAALGTLTRKTEEMVPIECQGVPQVEGFGTSATEIQGCLVPSFTIHGKGVPQVKELENFATETAKINTELSIKTSHPNQIYSELVPDEHYICITDDEDVKLGDVNASILHLSQKSNMYQSTQRTANGTNPLEVNDSTVRKTPGSAEHNRIQGRYFLRSSGLGKNADPVRSAASNLSLSDGGSMLQATNKAEIGHSNLEKAKPSIVSDGNDKSYSVPSEARYFLRSNVKFRSHRSDGAYHANKFKRLTEVSDQQFNSSWTNRRMMRHKSRNILATSPRSRARSSLDIDQHNECKCTTSTIEDAVHLQSASKLKDSQMQIAAPSETQQTPNLEAGSVSNSNIRDLVILSGEVNQNKYINQMASESKINQTSGGSKHLSASVDLLGKEALKDHAHYDGSVGHRKTSDAEKTLHSSDISNSSCVTDDKVNYNEFGFEGFNIDLPHSVQDKAVHNIADIPSLAKERIFVLEQLLLSSTLFSPSSAELSTLYEGDNLSDKLLSSSLEILETKNLDCSFNHRLAGKKHASASSSDNLMDIHCNFESQLDCPALERMHPSTAWFFSEPRKPPLTPPVQKFSHGKLSRKSNSSSAKISSKPELMCFRIDENSSTTEDTADHVQVDFSTRQSSSRNVALSKNSMALSDVTALYQNTTGLVSNVKEFEERSSLDSVTSDVSSFGFGYLHNGMSKMEKALNARHSDRLNRLWKATGSIDNMSGKSNQRKRNTQNMQTGCKPSNVLSNFSSFVPLFQKKQGAPPLRAKKDIKVKALEVAESSKRLEVKKKIEREMRRAAVKLQRERAEQENVKQLEHKKNEKEEKRKKDEDIEIRKRQRKEEVRKAAQSKRHCNEKLRLLPRGCEDKKHHGKEKDFQHQAVDEKQKFETKTTKFKGHKEQNLNHKAEKVQQCTVHAASVTTKCAYDNFGASNGDHFLSKGVKSSDDSQEAVQNLIPVMRTSMDLLSYEMSPYQSSDDEAAEEDSWRKKKFIPLWARRESLEQIILSNQHLDPLQIFRRKRSFSLSEVLCTRVLSRPWR